MENDCGVLYLALGTRIPAVLAVSLRTLRRHWTGPVTVLADEACHPFVEKMSASCDPPLSIVPFKPPPYRAYAVKPYLPALSPYEYTAQVDADTAWVDSPQLIFDLLKPGLCIVTQFSGWLTTGPRMRKRIEEWWDKDRPKVEECLSKPYPALNTGVVAYHCKSRVAREEWLQETMKNPRIFIADEIAMNLLVPLFGPDELLVVSDRFNRSPKFPADDGAPVCLHFHGRKHTKDDRMRAAWLPEFQACWREDFGAIRSWCPAGDGRLKEYLEQHREVLGGTVA